MRPGYLSEIFVSFQGEGAHVGRRHLFVRLAGCNLRCRYCDTPDSLERTAEYTVHRNGTAERRANPLLPIQLVELVDELFEQEYPVDALAITGGEPLVQAEFISEFLRAGGFGVPVLLETNGVLPQRLATVLPFVDIVSMDIKPPSNTGERAFWEEHAAFLTLARDKDVYVKVLIDDGTSDADVDRAAALIAAVRPSTETFLQPIVDASGSPALRADRLADFHRIIRRRLEAVRVVPQTHKQLGIQ